MRAARHHETHEEEESYFVSMTDIMIGLLFIFVIMLMFFAMRLQDATSELAKERQRLQRVADDSSAQLRKLKSIEKDRDQVLVGLQQSLKNRGVEVLINRDEGVLRLPESMLFKKNDAELTPASANTISSLVGALADVLPCFTRGTRVPRDPCQSDGSIIEAILIEGHTDADPLAPGHKLVNNLFLSALRAGNTFSALVKLDAGLLEFLNARDQPVLGMSGYGEYRPITKTQWTEDEKRPNRRIDLRILMTGPRSNDAQRVRDAIEEGLRAK
jgi:flagellar motor protein MotB